MKNIAILGSTGSIGTQTLEVVREHPDELKVSALAAGSNKDLLKKQIEEFKPTLVSLADEGKALELKNELKGSGVEVLSGMDGLKAVAACPEADIVVTAVVGMMGILPTMEAILDAGYVLNRFCAVDQFPHTANTEAVALFLKP